MKSSDPCTLTVISEGLKAVGATDTTRIPGLIEQVRREDIR